MEGCNLLSHGQASVERGFNINQDVIVENLADQSLVSQRMIYDERKSTGSEPCSFNITTELRKSCLAAFSRYDAERQERKRKAQKTEKEVKADSVKEEVSEIKRQIQSLLSTVDCLQKQADKCYDDAELKPEAEAMALLATGNGLRKTIQQKKGTVESLEKSLKKLQEELKKL